MKISPLFALVAMTACADETVTAYAGAGEWTLTEVNASPFTARAVLTLAPGGGVSGQAPCNRFSGRQTAPYPWFALTPLAVTRMACPELAAETLFLQTLQSMSQSEVSGDVLILRNEAGAEMVFTRP